MAHKFVRLFYSAPFILDLYRLCNSWLNPIVWHTFIYYTIYNSKLNYFICGLTNSVEFDVQIIDQCDEWLNKFVNGCIDM